VNRTSNDQFLDALRSVVEKNQVLTSKRRTRFYRRGIRIGSGAARAVVLPRTLLQLWQVLQICVRHDLIIIMQAANTGLTAGSTPYGDDYDRDVVIVNTLKIDGLILLNGGEQIIAFAGATLYKLEDKLRSVNRSPHSIIGSSCIGASIVGGICNNSGGNLVNRGPAYTELSLHAKLTAEGELRLVNHLDIPLGETPEEILSNLDQGNFDATSVDGGARRASDMEYQTRVRDVAATTPARFNADKRRLCEASGCAGKLAVFAVRLDTFAQPQREQVFYVGTNDPDEFTDLRHDILTNFDRLPQMGEYMHRSYFDAADRYCKDTYLFIRFLGTAFLPKLFAFRAWLDSYLDNLPLLPVNVSDRVLQFLARLWPDHLPGRMRNYRDRFEHHLMFVAHDDVIEDTRTMLSEFSARSEALEFFECTDKEADAALLHRFVAGGASARYAIVHSEEVEGLIPLDIALPRNNNDWHRLLPDDILDQLAGPFRLSHFLCMVFHWDFVVKKGADIEKLESRILRLLDECGAKYPAEHNVGHLYEAEPELKQFYQSLDPSNSFNAGIGKTSRNKNYA